MTCFFNSKKALAKSFITPKEQFYVRNHAPIPDIKEEEFFLEVVGLVKKPLRLSMKDLKTTFPHKEVTATLQCAGNRRTEFMKVASLLDELPWAEQVLIFNIHLKAISNGKWGGVPLKYILLAAGVLPEAAHVEFIGLDKCVKKG